MDTISLNQLHKELNNSIELDPRVIINEIQCLNIKNFNIRQEYFIITLDEKYSLSIYMLELVDAICKSDLCRWYGDNEKYELIKDFEFMNYRSIGELIFVINLIMDILDPLPLTQT